MSRLLSVCDWLPPDFGAVGQYALAEARARARAGQQVTLVGLSSQGDSVEEEAHGRGRLRVIRLHRPLYDRGHLVRRALWTLSTNSRLAWAARRELGRADELLFTGSPPLLIHWLVPLNLLFRRPVTYRISDFHPECLIAELGRAPLGLRLLRWWTRRLRRRVDRFEALGEDQRRRLLECGVEERRIAVVPLSSPAEFPPGTEPLPRPAALEGRPLLLYSGNFGVAHDDATLIEGLRLHHAQGSGRVGLWLNATGPKADRVEARLRQLGLPVHRSSPVPLDQLARLLLAPDAHLITLRDEFVGYVLPSKVWACVASRRPVLFVGSAASDVHRICVERLPEGSYQRVDAGDAHGLARALERIGA